MWNKLYAVPKTILIAFSKDQLEWDVLCGVYFFIIRKIRATYVFIFTRRDIPNNTPRNSLLDTACIFLLIFLSTSSTCYTKVQV